MSQPTHLQRDRAESFGTVAENYDRYRPGYPAALIDDLVALRPASVLDIGCGTGKAARPLRDRGLDVLGVEVDEEMAAVARGHGIPVEVASFEDWDDRGRRFDLIVGGQSWHWMNPEVAAPKAGRLLNQGGTLALFWNHDQRREEKARAAIEAVYQRLAPHILDQIETEKGRHGEQPFVPGLEASGAFRAVETREYGWTGDYSADAWIAMVQTHSDHIQLPPDVRAAVAVALREAIAGVGGTVHTDSSTYTIIARV